MLEVNEIEKLISSGESERIEFKRNANDLDKIRHAICAFANDLQKFGKPGVVVIGLEDDGSCANIAVGDSLLRQLGGLRNDGKILPFPVMSVHKETILNCEVALIVVQPSENTPVRSNGRTWVRVGPRQSQATPEEEKRLTEKRIWGHLPFDHQALAGATIDDLDLDRFEREYLPSAYPPEILDENQREVDDQLGALRFLRDSIPTVVGILMSGKSPRDHLPGAYVQFVRFEGENTTDPIRDQAEFSGTLTDQIRQLEGKVEAHIELRTSVDGRTEEHSATYPITALRELMRNAIVHRDYDGSFQPIRIYWYRDRIEIMNPGGLYGSVTSANFGRADATDYRNPAIAEAPKNLGFMQRFGMGIARANAALEENGNPAAEYYLEDPARVMVTVQSSL